MTPMKATMQQLNVRVIQFKGVNDANSFCKVYVLTVDCARTTE